VGYSSIGKYKGEGENNKIDARVVIACTVDLGWESNKKKDPDK